MLSDVGYSGRKHKTVKAKQFEKPLSLFSLVLIFVRTTLERQCASCLDHYDTT